MTLDPKQSYPSQHHYVLKLHRTAQPDGGRLVGRLEHLSSGRQIEFRSSNELLSCLANELTVDPQTPNGLFAVPEGKP